MAYVSDESGREQVYVQTFPTSGHQYQVTVDGGHSPVWRKDGKEIAVWSADDRTLLSADVQTVPQFGTSALRPIATLPENVVSADVTRDLQHVLALVPAGPAPPPSVTVVLDWQAALKKR
jgi:hypothetical protein